MAKRFDRPGSRPRFCVRCGDVIEQGHRLLRAARSLPVPVTVLDENLTRFCSAECMNRFGSRVVRKERGEP